jgi:hypothetical protein
MALTSRKVAALIAAGRPGRYHDEHGLALQVLIPDQRVLDIPFPAPWSEEGNGPRPVPHGRLS